MYPRTQDPGEQSACLDASDTMSRSRWGIRHLYHRRGPGANDHDLLQPALALRAPDPLTSRFGIFDEVNAELVAVGKGGEDERTRVKGPSGRDASRDASRDAARIDDSSTADLSGAQFAKQAVPGRGRNATFRNDIKLEEVVFMCGEIEDSSQGRDEARAMSNGEDTCEKRGEDRCEYRREDSDNMHDETSENKGEDRVEMSVLERVKKRLDKRENLIEVEVAADRSYGMIDDIRKERLDDIIDNGGEKNEDEEIATNNDDNYHLYRDEKYSSRHSENVTFPTQTITEPPPLPLSSPPSMPPPHPFPPQLPLVDQSAPPKPETPLQPLTPPQLPYVEAIVSRSNLNAEHRRSISPVISRLDLPAARRTRALRPNAPFSATDTARFETRDRPVSDIQALGVQAPGIQAPEAPEATTKLGRLTAALADLSASFTPRSPLRALDPRRGGDDLIDGSRDTPPDVGDHHRYFSQGTASRPTVTMSPPRVVVSDFTGCGRLFPRGRYPNGEEYCNGEDPEEEEDEDDEDDDDDEEDAFSSSFACSPTSGLRRKLRPSRHVTTSGDDCCPNGRRYENRLSPQSSFELPAYGCATCVAAGATCAHSTRSGQCLQRTASSSSYGSATSSRSAFSDCSALSFDDDFDQPFVPTDTKVSWGRIYGAELRLAVGV